MIIVIASILASCPKTLIINHTDHWYKTDQKQLEFSMNRCEQLYKDMPCLKVFIKKEERVYNAVCGER